MIQLTRQQTVFRGSDADIASLRATYDDLHWLRLPQLVEASALNSVRGELERCRFVSRTYGDIGTEQLAEARVSISLLTLLFNDSKLFDLVAAITGQQDIACFKGRVYRFAPINDQHFRWHTDLGDHRLIAVSLNLSTEPHQGGVLQMRDKATGRVQEIVNTTFGDAILFKVSDELEHRVTPVEGEVPRTAFGGWFKSYPPFNRVFPKAK